MFASTTRVGLIQALALLSQSNVTRAPTTLLVCFCVLLSTFAAVAFDRKKIYVRDLEGSWLGRTRIEREYSSAWGYARLSIDGSGQGNLTLVDEKGAISVYKISKTELGGPDARFISSVVRGGDPSSKLSAYFNVSGLWVVRRYGARGYQTMSLQPERELLRQIDAVRTVRSQQQANER